MKQQNKVNRFLSLLLLFALLAGMLPVRAMGAEQGELVPKRQTDLLLDKAVSLLAEVESLPQGGDWNGQVNLNLESRPLMNGMRGSYYLVHREGTSATGYHFYVLDGSVSTTNGTIPAVDNLTMQSPTVAIKAGVTPNMAINLVPKGDNGSGSSQYLVVMGANKDKLLGITTDGKVPTSLEKCSTDGTPLRFCHDSASGWAFHIRQTVSKQDYCLVFDTANSCFSWTPQAQDTDDINTRMNLYRLWSTTALRNAIEEVKPLLNASDTYPQELYGEFLDTLEDSIALFNLRNGFPKKDTDALRLEDYYQEELDRQTNELLSYLTLLGSETEYIDIPVEILDFRADRILFQNMGGFSLRFDYRDFAQGTSHYNVFSKIPELPGELDPPLTSLLTGNNTYYIRTGLTKPKLVNGKPVYEEQTIAHVANGILVHSIGSVTDRILGWNSKFSEMKDGGITLGSWEETKKKLVDDNGTVTERNGDHLPWTSVTTAFDLAYYILHYMWSPVPQTNAELLDGKYCYNIPVPERQVMRLYKDSTTGNYLLDAEKGMGYSGKYILNSSVAQPGKTENTHPCFAPIDGLGFEKPGVMNDNYDTDAGGYTTVLGGHDAVDSNFLFTMHARGAFIYAKEKNQYFNFRGDDDVYFFVNDSMALDMGAGHDRMERGVYLNDIADSLGLVDGETYNFDMFYAERNPSKANLRFETNIQIVSRDGKTEKVQYAHTEDGENLVSEATGLGKFIENRQTINVGEVVAYGFGILNDQQAPLTNVSFRDDSLGVNISPDILTLCDTENGFRKNNGLETAIDDIRVYYRSHTDGVVSTDDPQELTYEALIAMLDGGDSVFTGSYFVRMENAGQLKALLQWGVPVGCQMLVYGFLRRTGIEDLNYTNTVKSLCYYIPHGQNTTYPVIGEASCQLRVPENSSLPQVRKLEVVLDYGKAIGVPLIEIPDLIHFEDGSYARVGKLQGFLTESYNGELLKTLPNNLLSAQAGTQFKGVQGTFTVEEDVLTYQPTQFLDRVETLYAVVELQDFYSAESNTGAYSYVVAELRFIPATLMYYETDFVDDGIFTLKQVGGGTAWKTDVTDGTDAADPNQDYQRLNDTVYHTVIRPEAIPAEAFYVDFDGDGFGLRYRDNPQYKGFDFDKAGENNKPSNWITNNDEMAVSLDPIDQSLSVTMKNNNSGVRPYVQTGSTSLSKNFPLNLALQEDYIVQVRMKMENFVDSDSNDEYKPCLLLYYQALDQAVSTPTDKNASLLEAGRGYFPEDGLNGEYFTLTFRLDNMPKLKTDEAKKEYYDTVAKTLRLHVGNVASKSNNELGTATFDYIYVGPEYGMDPGVYQDYLFFGFDGTAADTLRYGSSVYGTATNLDNISGWTSTTDNALTITKENGNGMIVIDNNQTNHTFDIIHTGTNNVNAQPLSYKTSKTDVCQVRFKIEGGTVLEGKSPDVRLEFAMQKDGQWQAWLAGNCPFNYATEGGITVPGSASMPTVKEGEFCVVTFPLWHGAYQKNTETFTSARFNINNLSGEKITLDYMYIGPQERLDDINKKHDRLFFDFSDRGTDKTRYSNPAYGSAGTDFDVLNVTAGWSAGGAATYNGGKITKANGAITFVDHSDSEYAGAYIYTKTLSFTPGKQDYARFRVKFDKTAENITLGETFTLNLNSRLPAPATGESGSSIVIWEETFKTADYVNDDCFHIFTVPLFECENYGKLENIYELLFKVDKIKGCSITLDWLYIGPLTETHVASESLYYGFGNKGNGHWNTDSIRYNSDTSGFINYDTGELVDERDLAATDHITPILGWSGTGCTTAVHPEESVLELKVEQNPEDNQVSIKTGGLMIPNIQSYTPKLPLNYHPTDKNVMQIRFRTENVTYSGTPEIVFTYEVPGEDASVMAETDPIPIPTHKLNSSEYMILSCQLPESFTEASVVTNLCPVFHNLMGNGGEGKIFIDYLYAGAGIMAPEPVYGYDSSYLNDSKLSNGSSFVVEGQGVKNAQNTEKYTEASFSFRGTGFDIISRTGMAQATISLEVWKKGGTEPVKRLTMNNKGELELYQIPVVSVQGLDYGDYDVVFWVNAALDTDFDFLDRGGQFHFDAVRIYDPMGEDTSLAPEVLHPYLADKEGYAHVKEIRNILLSTPEFAVLEGTGTGAVFVDTKKTPENIPVTDANGQTTLIKPEGIVVNDNYTMSIETYNKIGPKNEVYLAPGQAVAFMLKISTTYVPDSVDVGVKIIQDGQSADLVAGIVTEGMRGSELLSLDSRREITVRSATAQYYALPVDANTFFRADDGNRYCYIVLYNDGTVESSTNVLSLTDVKVAYDTMPEIGLPKDAPTEPEIPNLPEAEGDGKRSARSYFDFVVDGKTLEAAAVVMEAVLETPIAVEGSKLMHSLNLASDISVNYVVTKDSVADYRNLRLEVRIPHEEEVLWIHPADKGAYYYFILEGLAAVQMGDEITATLYMEKDGRVYRWEPDSYSVAQYAYAQLNKEEASPKLKTLCADLLRYGAAAQIYKNYRVATLADRAMTEVHRAYLSHIEAVTFGNTNQILKDLPNAPVTWAGKTLNLESKVSLKFVFDIGEYNGDLDDLNLRVNYKDMDGKTVNTTVEELEAYNAGRGRYAFSFDGLLAAELRSTVSVQIYAGDTPVSCTLQYSADTYGNNKTGTLLDLCKALFAYSDSAKDYFA